MTPSPAQRASGGANPNDRSRSSRSDGLETRQRIMTVAERLFADHSVERASLADIAEQSGQANRSAVQYHFGSREGLVNEIMLEHQASMDDLRLRHWPDPHDLELDQLIRCLIEPVAAKLSSRSGRYYLIILPQVVHSHPEVIRRAPEPPVLRDVLANVQQRLHHLPPELAAQRVSSIVTFAADSLADRARLRRRRQLESSIDDELFVENLIQMVYGALMADPPTRPGTAADGKCAA